MKLLHRLAVVTCSLVALAMPLLADGPADNVPDKVRRVPKLGVEVPAAKRAELEAGLAKLRGAIDGLKRRNVALINELLPDVEIYYKAVHDALKYQEFFQPKEIDEAFGLLAEGQNRAKQLDAGIVPAWTKATGLVVRGYVSKIDGSVQPYGLVVPASYSDKGPGRFRLDLWFHGRGENLSELNFLLDRSRNPGTFTPADTLVLHPYGRYCNAFKFAGEVDVLEALESVQRRYRVDEERVSVRGFSMGGAGAWHFAVHYADRWFAANPGAGFSETPEFLKVFQKEDLQPAWYEQKLWQLYDCNRWAPNLQHCPTVAYSGEIDIQKQAADVMERALVREGIQLTHIIGPKTGHSIHPQSREEIERRMSSMARVGRKRVPSAVSLTTYTLKYNRMHWLTVDALEEHWKRAVATAVVHEGERNNIRLSAQNVTTLTLDFAAGDCPLEPGPASITTPDRIGHAVTVASDRSLRVSFHLDGREWRIGPLPAGGLRKWHNLQGPIDDAFMDSFIFVRPTGKGAHELPGKWAKAELERAIEHWRRHFRGEPRLKDDRDITEADIAGNNLVVWGDAKSNQILRRATDRLSPSSLPIHWTDKSIKVAAQEFDPATHAVIAIYPNPLDSTRYIVLNSSFTFRDFAYLNNARQVPMLPDWAIVDLTTPPDTVSPGKIAAAGFFDESWQLKPAHKGP